jgi:hypothetical protein
MLRPHRLAKTSGAQIQFRVKLGTQNRVYRWSSMGTMQFITASSLGSVHDFFPGKPSLMIVHYGRRRFPIYHKYNGGQIWMPTVPVWYGDPGDKIRVSIGVLSEKAFIQNVPPFEMINDSNLPWLSSRVKVEHARLHGRLVTLEMRQRPPIEGVSQFSIRGRLIDSLRFHLGTTSLRFEHEDFVGQHRELALCQNGIDSPRLGLRHGHEFYPVKFISSDGTRLRLVYKSKPNVFNIATAYLRNPSRLYELGEGHPVKSNHSGDLEAEELSQVRILRQLERTMLWHGGTYDAGRIGAEIAYTIARLRLRLPGLILPDSNTAGKDLYTDDGRVVVQTRILTQTNFLNPLAVSQMIERELLNLRRKLREDFAFNLRSRVGYAILSYMEGAFVRTRIVKVQNPRRQRRRRSAER